MPFPSHIVLCCWYWEVETSGRDKASTSLWPWVSGRYKSVRAGQHSSEQVNRASSNPSGGPKSAAAQPRLLHTLTFANMNSLENKKSPSEVLSRQHSLLRGSSAQEVGGEGENTFPRIQHTFTYGLLPYCQYTEHRHRVTQLDTCTRCKTLNTESDKWLEARRTNGYVFY